MAFNQSAGQGMKNPQYTGLERDFKISGALAQGDPVVVSGNYQVSKAAAAGPLAIGYSGPIIGGTRTGIVTVETRFKRITTGTSGAAITAGTGVTLNASNQIIPWVTGTHPVGSMIGIALTGTSGASEAVDYGEL